MSIHDFGYIFGVDFFELEVAEVVRKIRNQLLADSDWTQLVDSPLSESQKQEWLIYRQELRDITDTFSNNLLETIFPNKPIGAI